MNERLKELYKTVILEHSKSPFHYEKKTTANHQLEAYNALCGDKYQLYLELEKQQITSIYFHGYGCAISKAATSILTQQLSNKTIAEAIEICRTYTRYLEGEDISTENIITDFEAFSAVKSFPERLKCANLSWEVVQQFLEEKIKE